MSEKIYCGNGKVIETKFGQMLKLSINKSDVEKLMSNLNERGWVDIVVNKRKEVGQHGHTHYLTIDTFQPKKQPQSYDAPNQAPQFDEPTPF